MTSSNLAHLLCSSLLLSPSLLNRKIVLTASHFDTNVIQWLRLWENVFLRRRQTKVRVGPVKAQSRRLIRRVRWGCKLWGRQVCVRERERGRDYSLGAER